MPSSYTSRPLVVLVGRPNVGKSTLYNRLIGRRQAIVADVAGTTRDRLQSSFEWNGKHFELADLAGIERTSNQDNELTKATQAQVGHSLDLASLIVWVVDSRDGLTATDQQVGDRLRKTGKPVVVAINKCDHPNHDEAEHEFSSYRFNGLVPISALAGRGIDQLLTSVTKLLPEDSPAAWAEDDRQLRITIAGRPNVGKSTLLNTLGSEERAVVSDVPGTTRDAIDTVIPASALFDQTFTQWQSVRIVDTAGIRRRGKIGLGLEKWSLYRTLDAVRQSEVVLFMIDSMEGMVHQDLQIAQEIVDSGRALVLVVNKWDKVLDMKNALPGTAEDMQAQEVFLNHLRDTAPFLYWVQVLFLSAKEQINTHVIGRVVVKAYKSWNMQLKQEQLDEMTEALRQNPRLKNLQKITLEHTKPPVFHLHVEGKELPHFSTVRFAENAMRETFQIGPTPIKIWCVPSMKRRIYKKR